MVVVEKSVESGWDQEEGESVKEVVGCLRKVVEEIVIREKMSRKKWGNGGLFVLFFLFVHSTLHCCL